MRDNNKALIVQPIRHIFDRSNVTADGDTLTHINRLSAQIKMSNEEEEGGGEDVTKKTERKRQREKQRRFDLTNAFDELATVLSKIEPGDTDLHVSGTKKKRKRSIGDATDNGDGETSGMTRLDLIGRTVDILKKLHADNRELRSGPPRESSGEQEVLVMVPTLTAAPDEPASQGPGPTRQPSYPPYYQQQQQQQSPEQRQPASPHAHQQQHPHQQHSGHQQQHPHQQRPHAPESYQPPPYQQHQPPYHASYQQSSYQGPPPEQGQGRAQQTSPTTQPNYSSAPLPYYSGASAPQQQGYGGYPPWGNDQYSQQGPNLPDLQPHRSQGSSVVSKSSGGDRNGRDEAIEAPQRR